MTTLATEPRGAVAGAARRLSKDDLRLYQTVPEEMDYMYHPSFTASDAEDRYFGPQAPSVIVPQWRQYPDFEEDAAAMPRLRSALSGGQEVFLFLKYNYARYRLAKLMAAQKQRRLRGRIPEVLTWYRRALEARAALANANMALVVAMAKRTRINAVDFGELVSEGNMALLRAVNKFDVRRGFKFSTYACRAILKSFHRLASKTGTYRQHFPTEFDPEMERSDEMDRRHRYQRELAIEDLRRILTKNKAELTDVERKVVAARFAVDGYKRQWTLEEVGQLVGLSKERVRQVQNDALDKLRAALEDQAA